MNKTTDLFGNNMIVFPESKRKKRDLFADHDAFVEKFEVKKTTDDCYTPPEVFSLILNYVGEHYDLRNKVVLRPFYPGGDYEGVEYTANSVVIDNPPFSIITKIVRFYTQQNIPFFLFAPHLTLFSSKVDCTHIVVGGDIIYENGAVVKTSFLSNMFGDKKIIGDAKLFQQINELCRKKKVSLPKYEYPKNLVTVSMIGSLVEKGISISIDKRDTMHCSVLDAQKVHGKGIFGSGFLLSEKAAAEKAAAEKAAAEKANVIVWDLSSREKSIINKLGI